MACHGKVSCDQSLEDVVSFSADPDIGGIGVILAFLIPGLVAICLCVVGYCMGAVTADRLNRFDQLFLFPRSFGCNKTSVLQGPERALATKPPSKQPITSEEDLSQRLDQRFAKLRVKRETLHRSLLSLVDQQLATGVSILIVAYAKHCTITQYYFNIVTDLAWISLTVLGATIEILAPYLVNPEHRAACHCRVVIIVALHLGLIVSLLVTFNYDFMVVGGQSTQCILESNVFHAYPTVWIALFFLVANLVNIISFLYPRVDRKIQVKDRRLRERIFSLLQQPIDAPGRFALKCSAKAMNIQTALSTGPTTGLQVYILKLKRFLWYSLHTSFMCLFCLTLGLYELLNSQVLQNIRLVITLTWSINDLFTFRQDGSDYGVTGNQNDLGFGQLVALSLLLLPLFALVESFLEGRRIEDGHTVEAEATESPVDLTTEETHMPAQGATDEPSDLEPEALHLDTGVELRQRKTSPGQVPLTRPSADYLNQQDEQRRKARSAIAQLENDVYDSKLFRFWCYTLTMVITGVLFFMTL